ncbi:MAG: hypothetical protein B7Y25_04345 [Alphaproteobacteria bacterium 16-39-46]|nr:MAG: hypothetical protein B7Y25_04345 [Alphaproteobacteria bacterium 16-39-46]OZA43051.1 MAG: hypothetical protein B7X84_04265 [Alphaproteobacteria bacterium 17-39-52]HQS84124.1 hypothetical protein [Alphaproteobacteria bacterium]HQS93838.1 hypothetical protein [Alphaproteobacteria bacterium]
MILRKNLKEQRSWLGKFLGLLLILLQGACSETPPPVPQIFLEKAYISIDPKANLDTAIAMDLLVVYEDGLVDTLFKKSALDYFENKEQILRDNPGQIDVWSWEVVPGQVVAPRSIVMTQPIPRGAVVFANYLTPGDHRIRLGKELAVQIKLGPKDFSLSPVPVDWEDAD